MVQVAQLSNSLEIQQVGFGTWQSQRGEVRAAVEAAIKAGYRHLDLAKVRFPASRSQDRAQS